MGVEISDKCVRELVDDHKTELTIEVFQHLHNQQQEELQEEMSSDQELGGKSSIYSTETK